MTGLVIGSGTTVFLTSTERGRSLVSPLVGRLEQSLQEAPKVAQKAGPEVSDILTTLKDAASHAESYASRVAGGARIDDLAGELTQAAEKGGATAGALWIKARQSAMAEAERSPDLAALGSSLEGWEKQMAAYEMAQHAADKDDKDVEASERRIDATFANPASPASSSASAASQSPSSPGGFHTLAPFYKCPVIQVSNSGPTAADRSLTGYTPWVKTAAGTLIRAPVNTACLSSGFGTRVENGKSETHPGIDFYNRAGGPIFAAGDGVVTFAAEDPSYGYSVLIDHGAGVEGHYAHMVAGSLKVHKGDHVKQGQQIGMMGETGRAYAVHLHYELRFAGQLVDPLYVGQSSPAATPKPPHAHPEGPKAT
jgi:murein DD-endopeptidase MepM/ murein hydrolase activator NlpD